MPTRSEHRRSPADARRKARSPLSEVRKNCCQSRNSHTEDRRRHSRRSRSRASRSASSSSSSSSSSDSSSSETGSSNSTSSSSGSSTDSGSDATPAGTRPRNRSPTTVDGRHGSPEPEVEIKTVSGREVADIVCLSPSRVENQLTTACNEIPIEMASADLTGSGQRWNRIRIVLGAGKPFPVSTAVATGAVFASDSLRSISLYSDDDVDCNDDGRSLDIPSERVVTADRCPEIHPAATVKEPPKNTEKTSNVEERKEVNDGRAKTADVRTRDLLRTASNNVDGGSRRTRLQEGLTHQGQSRNHCVDQRQQRKRRSSSSERKDSSPECGRGHRHSNFQRPTSGEVRRSGTEQTAADIVSADRGHPELHHRRTAEESTGSGGRRRTEVARSRSKDRRNSRSRSSSRHRSRRDETGSSSRSRTLDHGRREVDERRGSGRDVISVSGGRSDRQRWLRAPSGVERRRHEVLESTVPYKYPATRHDDRSEKAYTRFQQIRGGIIRGTIVPCFLPAAI